MRSRPVLAIAALAVVGLLAGAGVATALGHGFGDGSPGPVSATSVARTTFTGLEQPAAEAPLPSLAGLHPRPGAALQAGGPFDGRLLLQGLAFDGTTLRGRATVTSDVSDIIQFEALAGFYDRAGKLLGTARYVRPQPEEGGAHAHVGPPDEGVAFAIPVPAALRGSAVAAAVGVPVLVNE